MRVSIQRPSTFLIGVLALLSSAGPSDGEEVATTVCELKASPEKFNGQLVRLRAEAISGYHSGGMKDASCSGFVLLEYREREWERESPRWRGQIACGSGAGIERTDPDKALEWKDATGPPPPVTLVEDQALERLHAALGDRHLQDRNCMRRKVTATFTGRFDYEPCKFVWSRPDAAAQPQALGLGYGHMNSFLSRLVLQSVSDVVVGPANPCWADAEKKLESTGSHP